MGTHSQAPVQDRCFGAAVANVLRRRYPTLTIKNIAADLNCTHKAAENILLGHLSARTLTSLVCAYGASLVIDAALTQQGMTLRDYIAANQERARHERERYEARERELAELAAALQDQVLEARSWIGEDA